MHDPVERRTFLRTTGSAAVALLLGPGVGLPDARKQMYGLIGKMTTVPGQRDALIAILLEGIGAMPGCRSYVVARDPADVNALWITEVWDSKESHAASLSLPAVKAAIARGRPLIAGFSDGHETEPVGGYGIG
jgi:quinol monooxygenase YgiN